MDKYQPIAGLKLPRFLNPFTVEAGRSGEGCQKLILSLSTSKLAPDNSFRCYSQPLRVGVRGLLSFLQMGSNGKLPFSP